MIWVKREGKAAGYLEGICIVTYRNTFGKSPQLQLLAGISQVAWIALGHTGWFLVNDMFDER